MRAAARVQTQQQCSVLRDGDIRGRRVVEKANGGQGPCAEDEQGVNGGHTDGRVRDGGPDLAGQVLDEEGEEA